MKLSAFLFIVVTFQLSLFLIACSEEGSDDDNTVEVATISTANYKDLSIAATEASKRAADSISTNLDEAYSRLQSIFNCQYSGSFEWDVDNQDPLTTTLTFNNCINDIYTASGAPANIIHGSYIISSVTQGELYTFNNLTISFNGRSISLNGTRTCSISGVCDDSNLNVILGTSNTYFVSDIDGRLYEFDGNVDINENQDGSFDIDATIIDPDHGSISIIANGVTFGNCPDNMPDNGTIIIKGAGDVSATILFIDCTQFSATIDSIGASLSFQWSNI